MTGKPRDQSKIDEGARALERTLDVYEKILSKSLYLAGDVRSLSTLPAESIADCDPSVRFAPRM